MFKFIILLSITNIVFAFIPHTTKYKLFYNGFEIGTEKRILSQNDGIYTYIANAKTEGLAKWIKNYKVNATSVFTIKDKVVSLSFDSVEYDNNKIKKQIHLKFDENEVKSPEKIWQIESEAVDFLSLFLAISYDFKHNNSLTYTLAEGDKIRQYAFTKQGEKEISIMNEDIDAVKLVSDKITVYLAKEYDYLPVLIIKKKFKYELKSYKK